MIGLIDQISKDSFQIVVWWK